MCVCVCAQTLSHRGKSGDVAATLREAALSERDVGADAALILLPRPDPEHGAAACRVQPPQCRVLRPVKYAQLSATKTQPSDAEKYNLLACAAKSVWMSGEKNNSSCHMLPPHTHATRKRMPQHFKAVPLPLQSQAATIGLTCIMLDAVPMQLDYTSVSAFIRFSFC